MAFDELDVSGLWPQSGCGQAIEAPSCAGDDLLLIGLPVEQYPNPSIVKYLED
jgi:hypothetical protein